MPLFRVLDGKWIALGAAFALTATFQTALAQDKPTGAPLVLSSIETEQPVPLAILLPDGKTAKCVNIRLHWDPKPEVGPNDEATSFTLDLAADKPGASIFTAQLWSASLAGAMAWQQPWEGARWKVFEVPVTDGTGLDAGLAVGMIATSARRPYPPKTVVIGSLNPDGSLGPVSHLIERMNAAAAAGMTRVIIPSVQRFDTDATGQVVNMAKQAGGLHLECVPVDNLVAATEATMNDPLPETAVSSSTPKYSNDVASYIDDFAHREQDETANGLKFAPKEKELTNYSPHLAAIWKSVYADIEAGQQAYRGGQVYVAYQLFSRANSRMNGANALAGQTRAGFDVKAALAKSDDLHDHLRVLMSPPSIDNGELGNAVLVAEMADWAYDIDASLEGAQLVTKQTYSQRSDATDAEKDRAREAIIFANEQSKYLLDQSEFYRGLAAHIGKQNPITVDENAANLLPQLIPAQLATARIFTDGIRQRANDLRDGLLFDPRLVAYVNVLREVKADWDSRQHKKEMDAAAASSAANSPTSGNASVKPDAAASTVSVGFDPGNTYAPPHTVLVPTVAAKKLSDVAQCMIWVNNDCEIATLDEKYLRLSGTIDPATHEWHVKDRARLDALLQAAEIGARHGVAFAEKAEVDSSVLAMIYERAAYLRIQGDDASALEALRNYWRCALLGNMCAQLAHAPKAQPVDLNTIPVADDSKPAGKDDKKTEDKPVAKEEAKRGEVTTSDTDKIPIPPSHPADHEQKPAPSTATNTVAAVNPPVVPPATNQAVKPAPPTATNTVAAVNPSVVSPATNQADKPAPPRASPVASATNSASPVTPPPVSPTPPPAATALDDTNDAIPVAPVAKDEDYNGAGTSPATNEAPVIGPIAPTKKSDNADGHSSAFP